MGWDADDARDAAQAASWSERRAALAEAAEWEADEHSEWVGPMSVEAIQLERELARRRAGVERMRLLKRAAEDWAQEAARHLDFLSATELGLYRAVRALDGEA